MDCSHRLEKAEGFAGYVKIQGDNDEELNREGNYEDDEGHMNPRSLVARVTSLCYDSCDKQSQTQNMSNYSRIRIALSSALRNLVSSEYQP